MRYLITIKDKHAIYDINTPQDQTETFLIETGEDFINTIKTLQGELECFIIKIKPIGITPSHKVKDILKRHIQRIH